MPLDPREQVRRERLEGVIALAAPVLDFVLAVGDRVSRIVGPDDDYYPIRSPGEAFELPNRNARPTAESDTEPRP